MKNFTDFLLFLITFGIVKTEKQKVFLETAKIMIEKYHGQCTNGVVSIECSKCILFHETHTNCLCSNNERISLLQKYINRHYWLQNKLKTIWKYIKDSIVQDEPTIDDCILSANKIIANNGLGVCNDIICEKCVCYNEPDACLLYTSRVNCAERYLNNYLENKTKTKH